VVEGPLVIAGDELGRLHWLEIVNEQSDVHLLDWHTLFDCTFSGQIERRSQLLAARPVKEV
jgi:hypothetical protein